MPESVRIVDETGANLSKFGNASVMSAQSGNNALLVSTPGNWTVVHAPAANTQASASKAAGGAGVRHVCESICATFAAGATAPAAVQVTVNLRDGASGAGTVLWSAVMALPATAGATATPIIISDLNIVGSPNTAMTLEFSAAGGLNTFEAVSMAGYDIS